MISRSDVGRAPRAAAGFTLIEMIVVLTILGLMMTLFVGNIRTVSPATHARAAAEAISGALRATRSEALMTNRSVAFSLDLVSRGYQWGQGPPHFLPDDLSLSLLTSQDQLVSEAVGRIRFDPDGGSSGGRVSIAGGNRVWWVGVDWLTGRVSMADAPR